MPQSLPAPKRATEAYLILILAVELVLLIGVPAQLASLALGLAITELIAILLPAVLLVKMRKLPVRDAWRIRPIPKAWIAATLLLSVCGLPVVLVIRDVTVPAANAIFGPAPDSSWLTQNAPHSGLGFIWWLVAAAMLPGICEEALFRGAILGVLERKGPAKAIVISGLCFASFHGNPWNFVPELALGLAFGFVTIRSQSIIPAMLWHTATNAMALTLYAKRDELPWWLTLCSAIAFVAVGKWFLQLTQSQARKPSLLAFAPPADVSPVRRLSQVATAIGAVPLLGAVFCLQPTVFPTDKFEPEIPRGSIGIILRNRFGLLTIQPGDWISYIKERKLYIRRVTRTSSQAVWISDLVQDGQIAERQLALSEVTGKLIKHFERLQIKSLRTTRLQ